MSEATSAVRLHGDEAQLYEQHHQQLLRAVGLRVRGPRVRVEDACAFAWERLLERQPARDHILPWLITVATHEGWRLSRLDYRDARLDGRSFAEGPTGRPGPSEEFMPDARTDSQLQLDARDALEQVAQLPPRQRKLFALQLRGFSYQETSAITGDSLRTVDRQLRRAHAQVRHQRR